MKRFLMFVGVALVAAAMYVAASPASQQAKGPTEKQFLALQKKVATLSKTLKTAKSEADASVAFIGGCLVSAASGALPVSEFGDAVAGTYGYQFTPSQGAPVESRTALDIDSGASPQGYVQIVDPTCVGNGGLRHALTHAGSSFRLTRPEQFHH